ncbi:putative E3 ubiquitin-protein ligase RMA1H1-like [Capsicum annuum]|uniref:Uncharacterized protein n=1 Tax=Capsicum annuum TaxID=4072 RepID=A0A2G3AJJ3_CAPAN|nr:transcription termination factor MTERF5, chloroplastic [Capsicum annuum]KAF3625118.1 putative E3 ubiquitin-protein ligase RMA1H1-like [Capsicum annuum]KAF3652113.1 putative E3 ubiquitin-protein ligase RMA1H1-like [Capsicum annuum]PHT94358.1 hypothetical protein T459_02240 [Capsicum annuum]
MMFVKPQAISSALLFKFDLNALLFHYSTAAATARTHLLVKYLINSLGFSKQEAISASAKVGYRIKTFNNPDLSVNFLKQTGFNDAHIKILVSKSPDLLFYDVENTLKPKLHCLSEIGLSGSDLVNVLLKDWEFVDRGLDNCIKPLLNCLRNVLGSDENVVTVIKRCSSLMSYNNHETMEANLSLLRSFGCSNDKIKNFVLKRPNFLKLSTKKLDEMLHRVEKEIGVSPDSPLFLHIVNVLAGLSQDTVNKKIGIFKSFGWSDTDILTMLQKLPYCVARSETRIQTALTFLMKEVSYKSIYIASHPSLLTYSLEKRLKPRYEMWKLVNEKNLIKNRPKFYSVMTWPESKFLEKYVLPVKGELPDFYDLYIKRTGK